MCHRLKMGYTRFAAVAVAFYIGLILPVQAQQRAAVTLSGTRNGPVTVTEHSTTGDRTIVLEPLRIKRTATQPRQDNAYLDNDLEDQDLEVENLDSDNTAAGPSAQSQTPPAQEKPEGMSVAEGLKRLRAQNWITYSEGDTDIPQLVYNPQTKRFVPTMEAIRSLEAAPEAPAPRKVKRYGFKPRQ